MEKTGVVNIPKELVFEYILSIYLPKFFKQIIRLINCIKHFIFKNNNLCKQRNGEPQWLSE